MQSLVLVTQGKCLIFFLLAGIQDFIFFLFNQTIIQGIIKVLLKHV